MDKNPTKIKNMFDNISNFYDTANNIISLGTHKLVKRLAVDNCKFQGKVLDLCTGTGDIARLLHKKCEAIGLDFSPKMLEIAKKKHPDIEFIEGDCTNLPFEDNSFDAVTISFGFRNIENYEAALREIHRVLKPNGQFVYLEFDNSNILANFIFDNIVKISAKLFCKDNSAYKYLVKSKLEFFNRQEIIKIFDKYKLKKVKEKSFMFGTIALLICNKSNENN